LNPYFQIKFMLQNAPIGDLNLAGLSLSPVSAVTGETKLELQLNMWEWEDALHGVFVFKTHVFKKDNILRLVRHFEQVLAWFCESGDMRLSALNQALQKSDEVYEAQQLLASKAKGAARFKKKGRPKPKVKL